MVESGPGTAARRMHYFVASLSLRLLLLLCSVTGLVLLLTGSGRERFPPPFISLLDAEFGRSPALVCFLVVVSVACLYSVVTVLVSIPSLPPRLLYLPNLCTNHQLLCGLKISDKHQDSAASHDDMEEGLKKQEWLGKDENNEVVRENVRG